MKNLRDEPMTASGMYKEYLPPQDVIITLDPTTVRSRFAEFNPANLGKNNIMGGLAGMLPIGIAAEALRKQE